MAEDTTRNRFTVQGADPPVPVGDAGERAGPAQPSSNDCSVPLAGNQARGDYTATGSDTGSMEAIVRIPKILRTPPIRRARVNSLPERMDTEGHMAKEARGRQLQASDGGSRTLCSAPTSPVRKTDAFETAWRSEEERSSKRRRGDLEALNRQEHDSDDEGVAVRITNIIGSLKMEIMKVVDVAKERNTKREIKEAATVMKRLISQLIADDAYTLLKTMGTSMERKTCNSYGEKVETPSKEEILIRLKEVEEESRSLKERNADLERKLNSLKDGRRYISEEMLLNKESYEDFMELECLEWPSKIYSTVTSLAGTPLTWKRNTDHIVIYEEGKFQKGSENIKRAFEERFPELREIEEGVEVIKVCTKAVTRMGEEELNERWLIRAEAGEKDEVWFGSLARAKKFLVRGDRHELAVYTPGSDPGGLKTRKMLEFIFRNSGIKCFLYTRSDQKAKSEDDMRTKAKRPDALIISQEGKTYSDLLRVVRETVKPDSIAAQAVKTIRESRDGKKMVIILSKEGGAATQQLRSEIGKLEAVKLMDGAKDEEIIFIHDIDSMSTKEDVVRAVCEKTGLKQTQIFVGEFRNGFGGNQAITIRLPRAKAEELSRAERIRIGLNLCPIKERVEVTRCFRCWQYGHRGKDCEDREDNSKLCRKCGGLGHIAAGCERQAWCLTCKIAGHTSGSGVCPEFRKAVARERKRKKKNRTY